ncbi:hypothetical protein cypCar_00033493 [Cyprinus carpio]|nr:hypothetical protein cypCar_00033493 [Cyprinus carpio]
MDLHSVILFCASAAAVFGNVIKPNKTDVAYEEGSNVILSCSHSPGATDYIHWYRQYERSKPECLVLSFASAKKAEVSDVDPRLSVKVEKREQIHVDLKISSAAVSDSALYYCALVPTVTGNTLVSYKKLLQRERRGTQRKR